MAKYVVAARGEIPPGAGFTFWAGSLTCRPFTPIIDERFKDGQKK